MRWLFIDTSVSGSVRLGFLGGTRPSVRTVRGRSGVLLPSLASRFGREALEGLCGVCVVAGPGSFSSIRGGVVAANVLARNLNLPLVGVDVSEAADLSQLSGRLLSDAITPVATVLPRYDAEPNITMPKRQRIV
ncbi:hypothetical protein KJ925_01875 [Patescibacteria group bacterium]|nr:hypothetical protein [Patescibacteria group bacterium]